MVSVKFFNVDWPFLLQMMLLGDLKLQDFLLVLAADSVTSSQHLSTVLHKPVQVGCYMH